jgi:hypothetical protein
MPNVEGMMEPDFYLEVDTLAVCRHFDIYEVRRRWVVVMIPELAESRGPLPPGQSVCLDSDRGLRSEMSDEPGNYEPGAWACRRHFKSHKTAWHMAQEWLKRERPDLYQACVGEVREARRWRRLNATT